MRKTTALLSFALLLTLSFCLPDDTSFQRLGNLLSLGPAPAWAASPQAAGQEKKPQWKSRDEYDAFTAMTGEKDPSKKITLAEAFLKKFADTDFKDLVYVSMMGAYQQLGQSDKAIDAARKTLELNPDSLQALSYLSFVFPFVFKPTDADATTQLSRADSDGRRGLEALQKLQKPANVTDEQFNQYVKSQRAIFNGAIGFVALQRKDYAAAITSFKMAAEDNPSDVYTFYRLGVAYVSSDPRDYDNAIWNLARSVSLAKAAKNPAEPEIEKYLKQVYINYHGNQEGLPDIIAQAAGSPTPPEGFKVAPMEVPEKTGNPNIDAFNQLAVPLKLGGERAQKVWDSLKGQPLGLGGFIDSVEKGSEAGVYLVRIDLLDDSKAEEGVYDIELRDSTQPDVKNLGKGDIVRFQGKIAAYNVTPNFVLTLDGTIIDPDPLPAQPKPKPRPTRRTRR
jgi:tetratricopeptide (TPR) repeat protein